MWTVFINHINKSLASVVDTAQLFWDSVVSQISLIAIVDVVLVFLLLWWIYRKLRRTDLIKIFPRVFLLLIIMLVARILGLFTLFYVTGAILVIVLLSLAALYAPEIKSALEVARIQLPKGTMPVRVGAGNTQAMIRSIGETFAVLTKAHKPALVVIKADRSLARLIENGTKMGSRVRADLLIDFFANGSTLSKGAAIIEGDRIVAAGSTLLKKNSRVLFSVTNPAIRRVARDLGAVVIVASKAVGDISVLYQDNMYKGLSPQDLTRLLQTILTDSK